MRIGRWLRSGKHTPLMALKVQLDDDGQCVLVDEQDNVWHRWQVRRRSLEETFFGSA